MMLSPTQTTIAALVLAAPIVGFGVAPFVFPEVSPETPFCENVEMAPGQLNNRPVLIVRLCGEQYVVVAPIVPAPAPESGTPPEEPQFVPASPPIIIVPEEEERP